LDTIETREEVSAMKEEYVSVDDAAVELGVARATAWRWIQRQGISTFRLVGDRRTLIKRSDLARLKEPIPIDPGKELAA
jgi:excisionase family DNA binding protein